MQAGVGEHGQTMIPETGIDSTAKFETGVRVLNDTMRNRNRTR